MAIGTCKFFNTQKGYGFIAPHGGGKDVFVHISGVVPGNDLYEGSAVVYEMGEDKGKGACAKNVRLANDAPRFGSPL